MKAKIQSFEIIKVTDLKNNLIHYKGVFHDGYLSFCMYGDTLEDLNEQMSIWIKK